MVSRSSQSRSTALFFLVTVLFWTSMYLYLPVLPVYSEILGASAGLVGIIVGSYGFSQLVLRVPLGVWSDLIGARKPFIVAGLVAAGLGALGLWLTTDPSWLIVWRGLSGVGAAAWVAFTVLYSSSFPVEDAPRAMARISVVSSAAMVVANYAGGAIAQGWGWEAPFFVAGVLGLLGALAALRIQEKPLPPRSGVTLRELFRIATVPLLLAVSGIMALSSWTQWATVNGFSLIQAARLGATRSDLGMMTTVMQLGNTAGNLGSSYLADRVGFRTTVIVGLAIQAVGSFVVPLTTNVPMVGLTQILGGAGRGLAYPVLMGLSIRAVRPADRATAMGVFQAIYALGMFGGPATTGFLGDALGLSSVFIAGGLAILLALLLTRATLPTK